MKQEIKVINKISINGIYVDANKLTKAERESISRELNARALEHIGLRAMPNNR
jgi:hypothetical protein